MSNHRSADMSNLHSSHRTVEINGLGTLVAALCA